MLAGVYTCRRRAIYFCGVAVIAGISRLYKDGAAGRRLAVLAAARGCTFVDAMSENARMTLNLEHVACNVAEPAAMAAWYVEHLGMRVVRQSADASQIHFLADAAGRAVIEIYRNAGDAIPDYTAMNPIRFHIAFATPDPDASRAALVAAGATFLEERGTPDGSRLLMLRDPWGVPLQLCKRPTPLLPDA